MVVMSGQRKEGEVGTALDLHMKCSWQRHVCAGGIVMLSA